MCHCVKCETTINFLHSTVNGLYYTSRQAYQAITIIKAKYIVIITDYSIICGTCTSWQKEVTNLKIVCITKFPTRLTTMKYDNIHLTHSLR